jgi:hypothetical protein
MTTRTPEAVRLGNHPSMTNENCSEPLSAITLLGCIYRQKDSI